MEEAFVDDVTFTVVVTGQVTAIGVRDGRVGAGRRRVAGAGVDQVKWQPVDLTAHLTRMGLRLPGSSDLNPAAEWLKKTKAGESLIDFFKKFRRDFRL